MTTNPTITRLPTNHTQLLLTAEFPQLTPNDLFDYFTQPNLLTKWWPQQAETDPQPGGRYRLSWPDMNWELFGEYFTFESGRTLVFSWQWAHDLQMPQRQVKIEFAPHEDGSKITLTHGSYDNSARDQEDRQSHWDGWRHFLGQLQQLTP